MQRGPAAIFGAREHHAEADLARKPTGRQSEGRKTTTGAASRRGEKQKPVTIDLTATEVDRPAAAPAKTAGDAMRPARSKAAADPAKGMDASQPKPGQAGKSADHAGKPSSKPAEASLKSGPTTRSPEAPTPSEPSEKPEAAKKTSAPSGGDRTQRAESSETARPRPEAPGQAPRSTPGIGALATAAVLGGLVALAGAYGLQRAGYLATAPDSEAVTGLASRLDNVEARTNQIASAGAAARGDLSEKLTAAEQTLAAQTDAIRTRMDALDAQIGGADSGGDAAALAGLQERLAASFDRIGALEEAVADVASGAAAATGDARSGTNDTQIVALRDRIDALEAGRGAAIGALGDDMGALADRTETLSQAADALSGRVGAMESRIDDLETGLAAVDPGPALAEFGTTVAAASGTADRALNAAMGVAPAVAALSLVDALETGRPFVAELAAVAALVPDVAVPESLVAHASDGLPARARIVGGFQALVDDLLAEEPAEAEPPGAIGRLIRGMQNIVEVRPAGPVEGDDAFAIVSRIDDNLKAGNLDAALAEWERLDPDRKALSQSWRDLAAAERDAGILAASLRQAAVARLGSGS